jgi:hypothetical protein
MPQAKPMINNQNSRKFIKVLLFTFLVLLIAHLTVLVLKFKIMPESNFVERLDQFLNFDREVNFPTYFNAILLFLSAQTFLLIAYQNTHTKFYFKTYWYILSVVFLLISIDEFVRIHEWFIEWTPRLLGFGGTGILKFAWIIPYGTLVVLFGLYSIKFLRSLDMVFQKGYLICGVLYILGAIGIESVGGIIYEQNNDSRSFEYLLFYTTVEESLEMLSLILLLHYNLKFHIHYNSVLAPKGLTLP